MLTQNQIKHIKSLSQGKFRREYGQYIVEGEKMAHEWLQSQTTAIEYIIGLPDWISSNSNSIAGHPEAAVIPVKDNELARISNLKTANRALLVVRIPEHDSTFRAVTGWEILLDRVQDPGNMGTIIRIADWFGILRIICSPECADIYNPKVVQATMGGLLRVDIAEHNLQEYIAASTKDTFALALDGKDIHTFEKEKYREGLILMGNESKGLSDELLLHADHKVFIPGKGGAESLNVSVATGIACFTLVT